MDVLSHGLWGVALCRHRVRWWAAAAAGALPDVIAFLPARLSELLRGDLNLRHAPRPLEAYPAATMDLYRFSHSLLGLAVVAAGVGLLLASLPPLARRLSTGAGGATSPARLAAWLAVPWGFHLALDAPLHTADFFPTPLLWPFSEWTFGGIAWAQPWVLGPNVALLALALWLTWPRATRAAAPVPAEPPRQPPGAP